MNFLEGLVKILLGVAMGGVWGLVAHVEPGLQLCGGFFSWLIRLKPKPSYFTRQL